MVGLSTPTHTRNIPAVTIGCYSENTSTEITHCRSPLIVIELGYSYSLTHTMQFTNSISRNLSENITSPNTFNSWPLLKKLDLKSLLWSFFESESKPSPSPKIPNFTFQRSKIHCIQKPLQLLNWEMWYNANMYCACRAGLGHARLNITKQTPLPNQWSGTNMAQARLINCNSNPGW